MRDFVLDINRDTANPLALDDQLRRFKARFEKHRGGVMHANSAGIEYLLDELEAMCSMTREMGHELTFLRMSKNRYRAGVDMASGPDEAAMAVIEQSENGNVILFPCLPYKPIGDGI